jgi:hypothetical protein
MEGDWVKLQQLPKIGENVEIADRAFQKFQEMQTEHGMQSKDFRDAKYEVRKRLKALEDKLNGYLAKQYGIDHSKADKYKTWLDSHKPFHWFIEFYGIMKNGGFDVIIGNPPYIEYSKIKESYTVLGFQSQTCGNLYAFVIERSVSLGNKHAFLSLIVPHSLAATYRSNQIQELLMNRMNGAYSYFSRRPGKLFEGADQCLCIFIGSPKNVSRLPESNNLCTTYQRWYTEERERLFNKIGFVHLDLQYYWQRYRVWPKIGEKIESEILAKISKQNCLGTYIVHSRNNFYCHRISRYFIKATNFVPYFRSERDGIKRSDDFKVYYRPRPLDAMLSVAILNSSLFYWFWRVMFDGYHCGKENIEAFPFEPAKVTNEFAIRLEVLVSKLMSSFRANSERKHVQYKRSGAVQYDEFNVKKSKPIIDEIDRVPSQALRLHR